METEVQLKVLVESGAKIIQVVSYEWLRVQGFVNYVSNQLKIDWFAWSNIKGLRKWNKSTGQLENEDEELKDPVAILDYFDHYNKKMLLILEDFHPYLRDNNPEVVRYLRELSRMSNEKTIILSQPFKRIPDELSKEMSLIEVDLPVKDTLRVIAENVASEYPKSSCDITDKLLSSALGLTVMEATLAFKKAIIINGRLTEKEIPLIIREKESIIKKNGLLEYYHPKDTLDTIGGLENLKKWVRTRGIGFDQAAREFGLNIPKGVLLLGIPGCGKSLTAKVIARTWNFPLLRFDLGKVFGGIVGESERNIREALDVAKALSPCVLWIDEIEKGLSGVQSSGATDGGTTSRVFGTFLTWMQEKTEPVFVVATANDISLLPPELLRKGRFDEIFFVDLPSKIERENIFKIHLEKKQRDPMEYDLDILSSDSAGFTGAEIEEIVNEALFKAFSENRDLSLDDMLFTIKQMSPLSKTMSETINNLRRWAKVRARLASIADAEPIAITKEETPKLRQEAKNPFI